jgi:lipoprotein NlpI
MDYDEAIRINPTYAIAVNNRAVAYHGKGDNDHAVADFDDATRINPRFASVFQTRGRHFFFEGDFGRASADLLRANDLQDDAYTMLWLYFARRRREQDGAAELSANGTRLMKKDRPMR